MENELRIELPENCGCGSENLKVWGTRIEEQVKVEVRCMRCGKKLLDKK
jgi:DNA-directed RNA polymerase subunit RPC12/RpoP